jgi:preprotein translocase SecE subunit
MAKTKKKTLKEARETSVNEESLARLFWRGFFMPARWLGRGLAWLAHRPPLKQIGHGLRWFFTSKPMRFIAKWTGIQYIIDSWSELRGVTWPTFKQSVRLTGAVIIFSIIFGLLIAVVDFFLDKVFKQILLK